jgi:disulfide bond formation protein DsbB
MLNRLTPQRASLLVALMATAALAAAWGFQLAGYAPCPLCLYQRWAYYAGIPVTLAALYLALKKAPAARALLVLAGLMFLANAVFAGWHAGIEWKFWPGPSTCTGGQLSGGLPDLSKPIVMCDVPAIRIFGISLAGWNALVCLALAGLAFIGARKRHAAAG